MGAAEAADRKLSRMEPGGPSDGAAWPPPTHIVAAARTGDRNAVSLILDLGHPRIYGFYRAMGLSPADSDDVAADACEGILRSFPKLRDPERFEAWFWSIVRNRLRTALRRRSRSTVEPIPIAPTTPEETAIEGFEHGQIASAWATLSPRDREVLWLREVEGLDHSAIAGRLGLTAGAVRVATHRARTRLEEAYRSLEE